MRVAKDEVDSYTPIESCNAPYLSEVIGGMTAHSDASVGVTEAYVDRWRDLTVQYRIKRFVEIRK